MRSAQAAHPRSRGENPPSPRAASTGLGSSPLTRGKPLCEQGGGGGVGLIPAHAGKTRPWPRPTPRTKAHPRSRGENLPATSTFPSASGSSPLTRGKLGQLVPVLGGQRLIPAHAGKTSHGTGGRLHHRAHPRSRGENRCLGQLVAVTAGSSPLTRGKRRGFRCHPSSRRLIPAHAGKTMVAISTATHPWAHPRSRGENPTHEVPTT